MADCGCETFVWMQYEGDAMIKEIYSLSLNGKHQRIIMKGKKRDVSETVIDHSCPWVYEHAYM